LFGTSVDDKVELEKADVHVGDLGATEYSQQKHKPSTLYCNNEISRRGRQSSPLSDEGHELLTCSATHLLKVHADLAWHPWHSCEHMQMVNWEREEAYVKDRVRSSKVPLQNLADSSDDSDEFDDESCKILLGRANNEENTTREVPVLGKAMKVTNFANQCMFDISQWYPDEEPLPQLKISGKIFDEESDFGDNDVERKMNTIEHLQESYATYEDARPLICTLEWEIQKATGLENHLQVMTGRMPATGECIRELNEIREYLGYPPFSHPQGLVCKLLWSSHP
jgi:hypothetical protein